MSDERLPKSNAELADRDVRLLARALDGIVAVSALIPATLVYLVLDPSQSLSETISTGLLSITVVVSLAIMALQWGLLAVQGQTLAKMALGIRVERQDGTPVGFLHGVVLREWIMPVLIVFCGFVGLIDALMIVSDERRTLHDIIANTRVVHVGGGVL